MGNKQEEDILQAEIVKWYNNNYCLNYHKNRGVIFSVPNGGNRNKTEAMKLKATGLLAGVSDLIVILPNSKVLFVEVKFGNNKQQQNQIEFQEKIESLNHKYYVVYSLEQFKNIVLCSI